MDPEVEFHGEEIERLIAESNEKVQEDEMNDQSLHFAKGAISMVVDELLILRDRTERSKLKTEIKQERMLAITKYIMKGKKHVIFLESMFPKNTSSNTSLNESPAARSYVSKLPPLHIEKFYGDVYKFDEFWQLFNTNVHIRSDLEPVQKFNYLTSYLAGKAKNCISGILITNENYETAISCLKERYDDPQVVIDKHYKDLTEMSPAKNFGSSLRDTLEAIEKHLRCLENLGENINQRIFTTIITSKFPATLIFDIEKDKKKGHMISTNELINSLKALISAKEKVFASNSREFIPGPSRNQKFTTEALAMGENPRPSRGCVRDFHSKLAHAGVSHTLAEIRKQYWIAKGRSEVRRILMKCTIYKVWAGGPYELPKMPPLPMARISRAIPFTHTGLDYMGPRRRRSLRRVIGKQKKLTHDQLYTILTEIVRQRSPESRGDRYMLLTFEEPPLNIKAGWKENLATFMNELKNLQCQGMTQMGAALKHAFDVLNINRMQTGIDTYGQGRCPFFLEPSVIVVITDGGKLSNNTGVQEEFNLPMHSPIPGCELTREPFRWDQRLFSLVLRLSGTPAVERDVGLVPSDTSPIDAMCEVTGGRSYSVTSHRMLMQCIDSLVQKVQSGVVINFEKIGPDPPVVNNENSKENNDDVEEMKEWDKDVSGSDGVSKARANNNNNNINSNNTTAWHTCRKLIYVPRSAQKGYAVGFWPIPESFWPDLQSQTLPPRAAHPNVKFTCTSQDPMVIDNLPFDKYELEPSPLTQYILARKQPTVCWQVFVPNSYKNPDVAHPFGYLKASTNLSCVNLFVMPYNYPVLLPLLDELFKVHRQKTPPEWRTNFSNYLRTMPAYYAGPLRRALTRMGAAGTVTQNLVPEALDNTLSYSVLNYLKRLKNQAKVEYEKLCNEVSSKQMASKVSQGPEGVRVTPRSPLKRDLLSHPMLQDKFQALRDQLSEFTGFVVGVGHRKHRASQSYRNAFDIPRKNLLDQILRMRANFLNPSPSHTKLQDDDVVHSMPISQMGNYQEYLKKTQPLLREIESTPVRQHMFGNPFKIDKRMMMVDEADIDLVGGPSTSRGLKRSLDGATPSRPNKRKPGPIPREVTVRRPSTPASPVGSSGPISPPGSPAYLPSLDISPPGSPAAVSPAGPASSNPSIFKTITRPTPPVLVAPTLIVVQPPPPAPTLQPTPPASPAPAAHIPVVPPTLRVPSPPPLLNGDINCGDLMIIEDESPPRSPSPPMDGGEFAPPPVLQPYDGGGAPGVAGGACPRLAPSYSVTPPLSPPPLIAAPAPPSPPIVPSKKELADIKRHNLNIRTLAYKEVRRPGLNYEQLFAHLAAMKGTSDQQIALLKDVINESLRFKRRNLASRLDRKLKALSSNHSLNHRGHNGSR